MATNQNQQPDPLEAEVQTALDSLCADPRAATWSYDHLTRRVKAAIGQVALKRGSEWCSSETSGECLWDGAMQERDAVGNLVRVPLALESEWMGKACIKDDFEKLLASSAEHRVMVCTAYTRRGVERHFDRLRKYIGAYSSRPGDRYLLAGLYGKTANSAGHFIFELHIS